MKSFSTVLAPLGVAICMSACSVGESTHGSAECISALTDTSVSIGILHSLSGPMAISEKALHDVLLMGVEEINAQGGVLGRKIIPVVKDPMSSSELFASMARDLVAEGVPVVFGCWTSTARKAVLPTFEQSGTLLFYSVQHEGLENSQAVVYSGATPNQQILPALDFVIDEGGLARKSFFLLGSDYVYPHLANKLIRDYLSKLGVPDDNIAEEYVNMAQEDYSSVVRRIASFAKKGDACVLSTINGEGNVFFAREFIEQGLSAAECPIMSFSVTEAELASVDAGALAGHYAAWNYFSTVALSANYIFVDEFRNYCRASDPCFADFRLTNDPMCWSYTSLMMWKKAVEKAQSFKPIDVSAALRGLEVESPAGTVRMDEQGRHLAKPVMIGRIRIDGEFEIVYTSSGLVEADVFGASVNANSFSPSGIVK